MKILRTASLGSNFTGSYKKKSVNEKKAKGKPDKINELILKTKANLKEGPDNK